MNIKSSLKNLASDSVIYGLSGVLTKFISLFLTPLYTRIFTPDDYGVIGILANGYVFITILLVFAMDNSTARWFYDTESFHHRKQIINTWFWFYLVLSLGSAILLFFSAHYWAQMFLPEYADSYLYIRLIALTLVFVVLPSVATNILRFERKPKSAVFLSLFQALSLIFFNVLYVLLLKWGIVGVYYAQLSSVIFTLPLAIYLIKYWIGSPKWFTLQKFKEMVSYALPFIPASIGFWVVNLSGVFFLNEYVTKNEVGLFQIGISIAAVAGIATMAFQQAWSPFSFSILNQKNSKEIYAAAFTFYVLGIGFLCTIISLFAYEALIILTTPLYYGASLVAGILVFNYFLMGLTNIAGLGASIAKKTAPLGTISLISSAILISLNFLLIPYYGKEGAALAICFAQLIIPLYMFRKSQKYFFIPYDFKKNILVLLSFVVCVIVSIILKHDNFFLSILIKLALLSITSAIVFYLNKEDLIKIKVILYKKFNSAVPQR
ncbi:lipopolysaccharide biosynthesis protein [Anditalea andensis]|uniref:Uncharacterized protein n=1 Tax=Anditalea andensis TaxID=1048983 RepID=A0A074KZ03_9BACT|nr:oligosaccharide flippase family protein [Anditalea andensis]KEO73460.1 hypothetical protein EL17_11165 [Anditalea andensis]